jgi:hypothetical protein
VIEPPNQAHWGFRMYCEYEAKNCPDSEFSIDARYGWVHNVVPRHTVAGDLTDGQEGHNLPTPPLPVREPLPDEEPTE